MKGATGPTSVDAVALSSWLLCFGLGRTELREEMACWAEWLATPHHYVLHIEKLWQVT